MYLIPVVETIKLYFQINSYADPTAALFKDSVPHKNVNDFYDAKLVRNLIYTKSVCNMNQQQQN